MRPRPSGSLAKTVRPRLPRVLPRRRLFGLLDRSRRKPLVWVMGPPGSGKTTLVASYLDARRLRALWYQVDEGDGDVATFFYYMALAAKRAGAARRAALRLLTPEYRGALSTFARRYFQVLYAGLRSPFVVVLDNYHEAPSESALHDVIRDGVSELPEGGAVIVLSRSEPPPSLARLRASGALAVVGWDALRLTVAEAQAIVRLRGRRTLRGEAARQLHARTDGWAAGLVLVLERAGAQGPASRSAATLTPEATFDYFAGEILRKTDRVTRSFLLRTAFLSQMTARMAATLTGVDRADRLLGELNRRNYFTEKRAQPEPIYQYHPLFREFLLSEARKRLSRGRLARVQRSAATLLAAAGRVEHAVTLLQEAEDWDGVARLALREAATLVAHGRGQTLEGWLASLPEGMRERDGWLQYWLGVCRLPASLGESRRHFERAFDRFQGRPDPAGVFLAWCGMVDAILYEWGDCTLLDRWIGLLDELRSRHPTYPAPEIEARVAASMFSALMFRQPHHPDVRRWAETAFALAPTVPDANHRLLVGFHLTIFYLWLGDLTRAAAVVGALRGPGRSRDAAPMAQLMWRVTEAAHDWHLAAAEPCLTLVADGLVLAEASGVRLWDYQLLAQGVYGALAAGDLELARDFLRRMDSVLEGSRRLDASQYHFQSACVATRGGDVPGAVRHARLALALATEAGTPFPQGLIHLALAQACHAAGQSREAARHLARGRGIGRRMGSAMLEFMALLVEAERALDRGDDARGLAALRGAMALGREQGYVNTPWWRPGAMARLAVEALRAGIETEYVRDLVRRRGLVPAEPPLDVPGWPWPVRVYTLGRFAVETAGRPLRSAGKVQQRPLAMLKALLALGGPDIAEGELGEALWPEAEGDASHQAVATTLHRLRQLVGVEDAVLHRGGRVGLNPSLCWVDAWAYDHLLAQAETAWASGQTDRAARLTEQALALYRGAFLEADAAATWALSARERRRRRFLRHVGRLGQHLERAGEWRQAVDWYERGLEMDELAEEFYQRLMACYQRLGHRAAGLAAYQRCRAALDTGLGVTPSADTEALHQALRAP